MNNFLSSNTISETGLLFISVKLDKFTEIITIDIVYAENTKYYR